MRVRIPRLPVLAALLTAALAAAAGLILVRSPVPAHATGSPLLIPAYFEPGAAWQQLGAAPSGSIVIANPENGPGNSRQGALRSAITTAQGKGLRVIGYVHTSYGKRPVASVERDINRWQSFYGLHDIFFDETASTASALPYYRTITRYARSHGAKLIVVNPGDVPARGYFSVADVVVDFEGTDANYAHASFPSWTTAISPAHVAQIVIAAPAGDLSKDSALAASRGAGYTYITDGRLPNPYGKLPSYFAAEALGPA